VIYLDSSAIVKLIRKEAETEALRVWLAANSQPLVTSALARTEAARALLRTDPAGLRVLPAVLAVLNQRPVTDVILDVAAGYADPTLRSLDAIHLATAERLRSVMNFFVSYDKRLNEAARARHLPVVVPS
jgi:hypothetical protein